MPQVIHTTCPYCGVGCGVEATYQGETRVDIAGLKSHPANAGRLCVKGSNLGLTTDLDGRLLTPLIGDQPASWDEALSAVAEGFSRAIREYGPDSVAFYVSGQILTEDYYVANKLMKGYIGSANIDTNSRLCMASAVAGYKRAFGSDTVPTCYEDLELADLIVIVGSNTAWAHPIVFQRISAAKAARPEMKIVVVDPRTTPTCDIADLHLPLKPGSDAALFNGLLAAIADSPAWNQAYLDQYCEGFDDALAAARRSAGSVQATAEACELSYSDVAQFFDWVIATEKTVTLYSQGVNQSSSGADKSNAIINTHLATGRIGREGMGPFSITGQPNAMGGREVGGLANMLAAHMNLEDAVHRDRVQRFWESPTMASRMGLKAVDMMKAVEEGRIKAIWIMATNPVVSMPDADQVKRALEKCPLVVVSDIMAETDTSLCADIRLPATGWGEKDGTVTNSERRISRQRGFMSPPGQARHDWWIICEVARRMGFEGFEFDSPASIFREHAALSGFENNGARDFDISALEHISDEQYDLMEPVQWPVTPQYRHGTARMFTDGRFFTPSGKARLIAIEPRAPQTPYTSEYPLVLNTGRVRDQWHTMTRTGKSGKLLAHTAEPYVEVHPDDAQRFSLQEGQLAELSSRLGRLVARVVVAKGQRAGSVFVPMHWNDQYAYPARVDALVEPVVDPISGQPELKHSPVAIRPYIPAWQGFMLSRAAVDMAGFEQWVKIPGEQFFRYEFSGKSSSFDWQDWLQQRSLGGDEMVEYADEQKGSYRWASIRDGRLQSVIFIAKDQSLPARNWLAQLFSQDEVLSEMDRRTLLAGQSAVPQKDCGPTVCSCFGVGLYTIREAIVEHQLKTPEAIGHCLKAGTNCGSCVPELRGILQEALEELPVS